MASTRLGLDLRSLDRALLAKYPVAVALQQDLSAEIRRGRGGPGSSPWSRMFRLKPPHHAPENSPWPVRIRTLGGFDVPGGRQPAGVLGQTAAEDPAAAQRDHRARSASRRCATRYGVIRTYRSAERLSPAAPHPLGAAGRKAVGYGATIVRVAAGHSGGPFRLDGDLQWVRHGAERH